MRKDSLRKKARVAAETLIQINLKLQTASDLKKMKRLQKLNPGVSRTKIVRMAWDLMD